MRMTDTATPETVTAELVPAGRQTIFDIPDVELQLVEAHRQATAITRVIDAEKLSMRIGRSEHVLFEGWATLGAFNGVSVHTVWSRALEDGAGWEARAEARTLDGRVVGTAEAMCSRAEHNWKNADDYAIRSMAQTRAGSKAFKGPLSWVMVLAGKSATPAEEVSEGGDVDSAAKASPPPWAVHTEDVAAVAGTLVDLLNAAGVVGADVHTSRIGQNIFDQCDGGIPHCVDHVIQLIYKAITDPPASDTADEAPAAVDGTEGETA